MKKILNKIIVIFIVFTIINVFSVAQIRATETTTENSNTSSESSSSGNKNTTTSEETAPKNTTPSEEPSHNSTSSNTNTNKNSNKTSTNTTSKENNNKVVNKSSDCDLKSLTIGEGTLSPVFSKDVVSYKVKFPANYNYDELKEIKIVAQANDSKATVAGSGVRSVNSEGNTNLAITVRAENGKEKIYTITIEKPKTLSKSDLKLSTLTVDKKTDKGILSSLSFTPGFNSDTLEYSADVEAEITSVVIYAKAAEGIDVEIEGANEDGSYDLTGGKNTIYVTLTSAQDENLVTNYKITINKPETLEESSSTLNTIKAKKKFNVMPVVIAVIVVLAVILFTLMIINHRQKVENGDYDDEDDYEDEEYYDEDDDDDEDEKPKAKRKNKTKEDVKKKKEVKSKSKNKDNGKRFAD